MGLRKALFLFCSLLAGLNLFAEQTVAPAGNHRGEIKAAAMDSNGEEIYSAGKDGYVVRWSVSRHASAERYQLSPYGLTGIALRPGTSELAVVESDGFGLYRVSAWDFKEKRKLFTLRFRDAVSFISYSERGSYLIVARNALDGLVILDPETGNQTVRLKESTGSVNFAATGKSERTMISCASTGELSYWNLADGSLIQRSSVPLNLKSLAIFGAGRFMAGLDDSRLLIMDAIKGTEIARKPISGSAAIVAGETPMSVRYLRKDADGTFIGSASVGQNGEVSFSSETSIFVGSDIDSSIQAVADAEHIYLSAENGTIASTVAGGEASVAYAMQTRTIRKITDVSFALGKGLMLALGDELVGIPSTPEAFKTESPKTILHERADHILAIDDGPLIIWNKNGEALPRFASETEGANSAALGLNALPTTADHFGRFALLLDQGGTLTLFDTLVGRKAYTFSSVGMLDAAIIDEKRLLIAKSAAVPPFAPLIATNYVSGETVPLGIAGKAAVRLHRGPSGLMYAIIADSDEKGPITRLIRFDPEKNVAPTTIFEYRAEDVQASIAEVGASVATTLGGDGISLFTPNRFAHAERTASLPQKLVSVKGYLVALCDDGSLVWHDAQTGKTIAEFRFYGRDWEYSENGVTKTGSF